MTRPVFSAERFLEQLISTRVDEKREARARERRELLRKAANGHATADELRWAFPPSRYGKVD